MHGTAIHEAGHVIAGLELDFPIPLEVVAEPPKQLGPGLYMKVNGGYVKWQNEGDPGLPAFTHMVALMAGDLAFQAWGGQNIVVFKSRDHEMIRVLVTLLPEGAEADALTVAKEIVTKHLIVIGRFAILLGQRGRLGGQELVDAITLARAIDVRIPEV